MGAWWLQIDCAGAQCVGFALLCLWLAVDRRDWKGLFVGYVQQLQRMWLYRPAAYLASPHCNLREDFEPDQIVYQKRIVSLVWLQQLLLPMEL